MYLVSFCCHQLVDKELDAAMSADESAPLITKGPVLRSVSQSVSGGGDQLPEVQICCFDAPCLAKVPVVRSVFRKKTEEEKACLFYLCLFIDGSEVAQEYMHGLV